MRVAIVTAHDAPYADLAAITLPSLKAYADKHGYELWYDPDIPSTEKDACKVRIFLEMFASGEYGPDDVYMWVDSDALVMNSDIKVETIVDRHMWNTVGRSIREVKRSHYMVGYDFNGINTGTWIARFTSQAAHFLEVARNAAVSMGWSDQPALLQKMIEPPFSEWVTVVPGKVMNAMPYELYGKENMAHKNDVNNYADGDWILHLAGIEEPTRSNLLREYAARAK